MGYFIKHLHNQGNDQPGVTIHFNEQSEQSVQVEREFKAVTDEILVSHDAISLEISDRKKILHQL